jgi:hypothetical protein
MAILLLNKGGKYVKLVSPYVQRRGELPTNEVLRDHMMLDLVEDATVLSTIHMDEYEIRNLWMKFGNDLGSTDDAPTFVRAFINSGAVEVK